MIFFYEKTLSRYKTYKDLLLGLIPAQIFNLKKYLIKIKNLI